MFRLRPCPWRTAAKGRNIRMTTGRLSMVATSHLRAELERHLGCQVAAIRRSPSLYSSSVVLEEISVELATGVELELVLKDLSPSGALHSGRDVRPDFIVDAMREIETYRLILAGRQGTAKCYAAFADPCTQQYWLLLERVPGIELYQSGDIHAWQAVARWLSRLHIWGSGLAESVADDAHLLLYTRSFYARWMQRT